MIEKAKRELAARGLAKIVGEAEPTPEVAVAVYKEVWERRPRRFGVIATSFEQLQDLGFALPSWILEECYQIATAKDATPEDPDCWLALFCLTHTPGLSTQWLDELYLQYETDEVWAPELAKHPNLSIEMLKRAVQHSNYRTVVAAASRRVDAMADPVIRDHIFESCSDLHLLWGLWPYLSDEFYPVLLARIYAIDPDYLAAQLDTAPPPDRFWHNAECCRILLSHPVRRTRLLAIAKLQQVGSIVFSNRELESLSNSGLGRR